MAEDEDIFGLKREHKKKMRKISEKAEKRKGKLKRAVTRKMKKKRLLFEPKGVALQKLSKGAAKIEKKKLASEIGELRKMVRVTTDERLKSPHIAELREKEATQRKREASAVKAVDRAFFKKNKKEK